MLRSGSTSLRYLVTSASVVVGVGYAAWDFSTVAPTLPPAVDHSAGEVPPEVSRAIFDACVTFYGCVYAVGNVGYRLLGRTAESVELRRWSRWHMWLLNGVGGAWLAASAWQSFRSAELVRPLALIGAVLILSSMISLVIHVARGFRAGRADT